MTKEEIIEFTRKAGGFSPTPEFLEAFAKLVADRYEEPLHLALAELYRHATDTESGEKAIAAVEGVLK